MPAGTTDNGILVGVVESLDDPEGLERVRVRLPTLGDQVSTEARLATPFGGKDRGLLCKPEVGDEVLVALELGDIRRPCIIGSLWSKVDPPPQTDGKPTENNWRFLRSRSGHILRFDDTAGAERIELIDKDAQRRIVIDCSSAKLRIECDSGDIEITAQANVTVKATTVNVEATGNMTLKAGGQLKLQGSTVEIN